MSKNFPNIFLGIILIMYYVVFGLVVAWNFGSSFSDLKFSVYGYPPIVVIVCGIFFTAYEFLDAREHMIHMNVSFVKKSQQVSYKRLTAILEMRHMLIESGMYIFFGKNCMALIFSFGLCTQLPI